jgi:hypothetical protein
MMRRSTRAKKPTAIFDPSAEEDFENSVDHKSEDKDPLRNPWDVPGFETFHCYFCPECNQKFTSQDTLAHHSASKHIKVTSLD